MNIQTDNPQRKVSEIEIAWLAGFIDGEGSIGLKVQKYMRGKKVFYVAPYVHICNTHLATLDYVDYILKGLHIGHYFQWAKPHRYPHGKKDVSEYKPLWRLMIDGMKRCKPLLLALIPYIVTKLDDAKLVMEFIESREASHYKHLPYTEKELRIINRYRRIVKKGISVDEISLESLNDYTQDTLVDSVKV